MTRLVSELAGVELDYWVARAEGAVPDISKAKPGQAWCAIEMVPNAIQPFPACIRGRKVGRGKLPYRSDWFYPSSVSTHSMAILERECISLIAFEVPAGSPKKWAAYEGSIHARNQGLAEPDGFGPTPLIAAMRCYVRSVYGNEVPDEVAP